MIDLGRVSMRDFTEARILITEVVVRLACERGKKKDFDAIEKDIDRLAAAVAVGDGRSDTTYITNFYDLLAAATGNQMLRFLTHAIARLLARLIDTKQPPQGRCTAKVIGVPDKASAKVTRKTVKRKVRKTAKKLERSMREIDARTDRLERRIDQVTMIFQQPLRTVELAAFFVGGEGEDEIALGLVAFAMEPQKCPDKSGIRFLHVLRATAVEVAVLLDELKRICMPVARQSFYYVEMAKKEDGLFASRRSRGDAHNQIHLVRIWAKKMHILRREACINKKLPGRIRSFVFEQKERLA